MMILMLLSVVVVGYILVSYYLQDALHTVGDGSDHMSSSSNGKYGE